MTEDANPTRRAFLRASLYALSAPALGSLISLNVNAAEDLPKLSLDDPQAKSLKYVHDAAEAADTRKSGEFCRNCKFYQGEKDSQWGKCQIFPGKLVNHSGWCLSYAKA